VLVGRSGAYAQGMNVRLALIAAGLEALLVGAVFFFLLALPLPDGFFRDYGAVAGPTAWLVCSLVTGRLIRLPLGRALLAALGSGLVAGLVGLGVHHTAGLVVGILAFGALAGAMRPTDREPGAVGAAGIEPAFSGLKGRRPNH
jgi:hypothetical protein